MCLHGTNEHLLTMVRHRVCGQHYQPCFGWAQPIDDRLLASIYSKVLLIEICHASLHPCISLLNG